MMEILPRRLLFGVCAAVALAIGFADAGHGESTAPVVVVGLAKCSDCTRKSMNTEAAFKGLKVAVKCKNGKGEYESKALGQVDKSGAFSIPLAADLISELRQDCFAQLHSASSTPCPGQEPSKIVAAQPSHGDGKTTFVALAGKMHEPSAECASVFLCYPTHKHHLVVFHKPVIVPPKHDNNHDQDHDHDHNHDQDHDHDHDHDHDQDHDHDHDHDHDQDHDHDHDHDQDHDHDHDHDHDQDHDHDHSLPHVVKPPSTPVYGPKPTPIYHPPAQHNAVTNTQLFKKLLPFLKKHDHHHHYEHDHDHDHDHDHSLPPVVKPPSTPVYGPKPIPIYHPPAQRDAVTDPQQFKKLLPFLKKLPVFPPAQKKSNP